MLYTLNDLLDEFKSLGGTDRREFGHFIRENYVQVYDDELEFLGYEIA